MKHQTQLNAKMREEIEDTLTMLKALGGTEKYRQYKHALARATEEKLAAELKPILREAIPDRADTVFAECAAKAFAVA